MTKFLTDESETGEWNLQGLPSDELSTQNGILVTRSSRWPILIDPQGQANKWIRNMENEAGLEVGKPSDKEFLRSIENALRFGKPFMMENVLESLDPALEPVLLKKTFKQGGNVVMKIGDNVIPYHPDFKFYLTTKLPNPHYLPEVCIKVTVINFTVTIKGLEDQLLGDVVRKERPDLEEAKDRLVVSISNDKKQLQELQDKILNMLKESEGNILDDEVLIDTLNNSKITSGMISGRLEEAETTENQINSTRETYRAA